MRIRCYLLIPSGQQLGVNSVEVKWVSPDDQPIRWAVGASVFDYNFLTNIYTQLAGVQLGLEEEANNGQAFTPIAVNTDKSTNTGVYANVAWDVSDRLTLSAEGRYQNDDVTNESNITGDKFNNATKSFAPRLAFTYAVDDNWSAYGQFSQGTNPMVATGQYRTQRGKIYAMLCRKQGSIWSRRRI